MTLAEYSTHSAALAGMTTAELAAYHNILRVPCLKAGDDGKCAAHLAIVTSLLNARGLGDTVATAMQSRKRITATLAR